MKWIKKLLGLEKKFSFGGTRQETTPSKNYINCIKDEIRHNPILLPDKTGKKLHYAESKDGAYLRFNGILGCPKCKQMFLMSWDIVLPKHWDPDKLEALDSTKDE